MNWEKQEDHLVPLAIGTLHRETVAGTRLGAAIHRRSGPWVPIESDDSCLLRIGRLEELLFDSSWTVDDPRPHLEESTVPGIGSVPHSGEVLTLPSPDDTQRV